MKGVRSRVTWVAAAVGRILLSLLLALGLQLVGFGPAIAQDCPEEPGETPCTLVDGSVVRGYLRRPGAVNVYRFEVSAPATTALVVLSELPADYDLYLTDESGQVIAQSANDGVYPEVLHPELAAPGSYFIHVLVDAARPFVASAPYRLQLALRVSSSGTGATAGGGARPTVPPSGGGSAAQPTAVPTATPVPPPAPTATTTATAVPQTGPRPLGHAWDGQGLQVIARAVGCFGSTSLQAELAVVNRTEFTLNFEVPAALFYIELNTGRRLVGSGRPFVFEGLKPQQQVPFTVALGGDNSCNQWQEFLRDSRASSLTLGVRGFHSTYLPGQLTWTEPVNAGVRTPAYAGDTLRIGEMWDGNGLSLSAVDVGCFGSTTVRVKYVLLNTSGVTLNFDVPPSAFYLETSAGARLVGDGRAMTIDALAAGHQKEFFVSMGNSNSCTPWQTGLRDSRVTFIQAGVIDLHRQRLPGEQRWRQEVQH